MITIGGEAARVAYSVKLGCDLGDHEHFDKLVGNGRALCLNVVMLPNNQCAFPGWSGGGEGGILF